MDIKITLNTVDSVTHVAIPQTGEITLGRVNKSLKIDTNLVSRNHVKIKRNTSEVFVQDISANGTFINGDRMSKGKWTKLKHDDKVSLTSTGDVYFELIVHPGVSSEVYADHTLMELINSRGEVTIGRDKACDIVIDDNAVSRKHAVVCKKGDKIVVQDYSLNGSFVNGKRINSSAVLSGNDVLTIGMQQYSLAGLSQNLQYETAIEVKGVSYKFADGNTGLKPCSFDIDKGKMVALMGPSGCGKSTLLNLLNGYNVPTTGSVKIFGLNLNEDFDIVKRFVGYVPQDNIVHEHLTVRQALYFTAKLRLGSNVFNEEVEERITDVLKALKIDEPQLFNSLIKNLSGGQKKRVSIAVELLTKPKILFLDEPTSPLDPETIEEFLKSLRDLSAAGTTIVMVTHKPEDLIMMDEVIFMSTGGMPIYKGSTTAIQNYFGTETLSQIYSIAGNVVEGEKHYERWNKKTKNTTLENAKINRVTRFSRQNPAHQAYWLIARYVCLKWNNRKNIIIAFSQPLLISLLILLVFPHLKESNPDGTEVGNTGVLFIIALSVIWFGISNSAKEIVAERSVYRREKAFNLMKLPYLLSKIAVLFSLTALQILLFLVVLTVGFGQLEGFLITFLFLCFAGLAAVSFGLTLSAYSKSTEAVMTMLPVALIPQIVLAGIVQPIENKLTEYLSYVTLGRWGTEGVARIQDKFSSSGSRPFMVMLEKNLYRDGLSEVTASITGNGFFLSALIVFFSVITLLKISQSK